MMTRYKPAREPTVATLRDGAKHHTRRRGVSLSKAPYDILSFLERPHQPASIAAVGSAGGPLLGTLWFKFTEGRFWLSTDTESFITAARRCQDFAVMVETFNPPAEILMVRTTGRGQVERHDPHRVRAIYERYLGADTGSWPGVFRERLHDESFRLISVLPERGVAATFRNFQGRDIRWHSLTTCPMSP